MRARHRFALLCVIATTSAITAPTVSAAEIGFRIVGSGTVSDATVTTGPIGRVVRDAAAAQSLFAEWSLDRAPRLLRTVDFRRRSLIVALGGWMPNPGHVLLPGAVSARDGTAAFIGTIFRRGHGGADVIAQPWAVVSVPREALANVAPEVAMTMRCGERVRSCWRSADRPALHGSFTASSLSRHRRGPDQGHHDGRDDRARHSPRPQRPS